MLFHNGFRKIIFNLQWFQIFVFWCRDEVDESFIGFVLAAGSARDQRELLQLDLLIPSDYHTSLVSQLLHSQGSRYALVVFAKSLSFLKPVSF